MYLKESGKVRMMMKYIDKDIKLYRNNHISMTSLVWAYLSKRVKNEYGPEVSWVGDQELWGLFIKIQKPNESWLDKIMSSFGNYKIVNGTHDIVKEEDYNTEMNHHE